MKEPSAAEHTFLQAREHVAAGRLRKAIACLAPLRRDPEWGPWATAGGAVALLLHGRQRAGLVFAERALTLDATTHPALLEGAGELVVRGHLQAARALYEKIVQQVPEAVEAWKQWVDLEVAEGETEASFTTVRLWRTRQPGCVDALLMEGEILSNRGDHQQAIEAFGEALRLDKQRPRIYENLCVVMVRLRRHQPALAYVERALSLEPESLVNLCLKGQILRVLGRWNEAADAFGEASALKPRSALLFLNHWLMLPGIPASAEEIEAARLRYLRGLALAEADTSLQLFPHDDAISHTFELAYHNYDDRVLLERYHRLMRRLCQPWLREVWHLAGPSPQGSRDRGRIRIGLLSQYFSGHSNSTAHEGLIRYLDRERFEVILIHAAHSRKDEVRARLDGYCKRSVELNPDPTEAYRLLQALELDILYFTDIGMNPREYLLPFCRTAPIQITGWGIPHTSGIEEIDFYVAAEGLEPAGSEELYTETLVRLPGGLPCCFLTEGLSFTPLPREYFFLPPGDLLIGCLQSLHKLHPDFDVLLEDIAIENPEALFVIVEDPTETRTRIFLDRLARTAPSVRERCITLATMSRPEYHALCNCLDLLLDPIYYGSGVTFFEACFVGTPIVTLEGSNLRSRVVTSGYREMGIDEPPIATSEAEYVRLVSELCNDPDRRNKLKTAILANNHRVFNRMDYVRNFEAFCLDAIKTLPLQQKAGPDEA